MVNIIFLTKGVKLNGAYERNGRETQIAWG